MQKNYMVKKLKLVFDGNKEYAGLAECSELKDAEGLIDVPTYGRKIPVKDGISKFEPITAKYIITRGSDTMAFFRSWKDNNEYHDVTVISTDAVGTEVSKTSLRDCECSSIVESAYNAATPTEFSITVLISCTSIPQSREV